MNDYFDSEQFQRSDEALEAATRRAVNQSDKFCKLGVRLTQQLRRSKGNGAEPRQDSERSLAS